MLNDTTESLKYFPAIGIIGPRQVGKTTLVKAVLKEQKTGVYLDLEFSSDFAKLEYPEFNLAPLYFSIFSTPYIRKKFFVNLAK